MHSCKYDGSFDTGEETTVGVEKSSRTSSICVLLHVDLVVLDDGVDTALLNVHSFVSLIPNGAVFCFGQGFSA